MGTKERKRAKAEREPLSETDLKPIEGYLACVEIKNIRSIATLEWAVQPRPGWNVVLGDNGAGKSTLLRSIATRLLTMTEYWSLRMPVERSLRMGETHLSIRLDIVASNAAPKNIVSELRIKRAFGGWARADLPEDRDLQRLFCAGFGPFRRFTGGDSEYERQFESFPRVARVLSLFDERVAMTETLEWIKKMHARSLEDASHAPFVEDLVSFINQEGFLPNNTRLAKLTVDEVFFIDGNGAEISISNLSDGYRAVLSLTIELIRQLAVHYGNDEIFDRQNKTVIAPGIVLIDEVDAHLHPRWQRQIGFWLREHFPKIQFIVTTHSPLICQAAEVGSIFRLARPGTDETSRMVEGVERDRLLYGDLVDAYGTTAIGCVGRSEKAKDMLTRLAELNHKAIEVGLSEDERKERAWLRSVFPAAEADS